MKFNKRIILILLKGLGILILAKIIVFIIVIAIFNIQARTISADDFLNFSTTHSFTIFSLISVLLSIFGFTILIYGGFFVGKRVKKGFLYGIILGILYFCLDFFIGIIYSVLGFSGAHTPEQQVILNNARQIQLDRLIFSIPATFIRSVGLIGIGGWLGECFNKGKNVKN